MWDSTQKLADIPAQMTLLMLRLFLRALDLVGAGNDGFAVFNETLVTLKPVGAECLAQALNSSLLTSVFLLSPNFVTRRFQVFAGQPIICLSRYFLNQLVYLLMLSVFPSMSALNPLVIMHISRFKLTIIRRTLPIAALKILLTL